MKVPGFTAEASLYESKRSYAAGLTCSGATEVASIHPAAWVGRAPVKPPGGGNGADDCAVCFGICVLVCWFSGTPNCVDFCYDLCGCKKPVIIA